MRVFQIVGVRRSGKTTTAEQLIRSLRENGYSVDTVKSINCPVFAIDSRKSSNTRRHRNAGAGITVAAGKTETDIMFSRALTLDRILDILALDEPDYVIVEGGYEYDLPRIVCLTDEGELADRVTQKTFAVSGVIAGRCGTAGGLPAVSALEAPDELAGLVVDLVPEFTGPVGRLPRPESCRNFCGGCVKRKKQCGDYDAGQS